ncbi:MAG: hypothetical protein LBG12_04830 [Synergistaceae bacterium]|jgi:hypothetical protein|nr:hypothetical protein [Synergistaceae bacterium]
MCETNEAERAAIVERMKKYKQSPETIDNFLLGKSYCWEATDEAVMAAVVIRMKLLNLSEEIIEAFERRNEIKVSNQVYIGTSPYDDGSDEIRLDGSHASFKGRVFSLSVSEPSSTQIEYINDKRNDYSYGPWLIYHVHRFENNGYVAYTLFYIDAMDGDVDSWEEEEQRILNREPLHDTAYAGDESWQWADWSSNQVNAVPVMGCVFRTDFPVYKEEALRFIESNNMKTFLRLRPDIMNGATCAKLVAFAPAPLELKIPMLELISAQAAENLETGDTEDYDPIIAAKAFRAALDERYENIPPGAVFLLHRRWLNGFGEFGRGEHDFWHLFIDFDAAVEYIVDEILPKLEEGEWYRNTWYEIFKCVPGQDSEMNYDFCWILNAAGEIWHFYESREFLLRHDFLSNPKPWEPPDILVPFNLRFCHYFIGLPTPYQPGEIVRTDCWPFSKEQYVVISSNNGKDTQCLRIYEEKVFCFPIERISGRISIPPEIARISTLYRAEAVSADRIYSIHANSIKAMSSAIKANPEVGLEMGKYITGDGSFPNHWGVRWKGFKRKFRIGR